MLNKIYAICKVIVETQRIQNKRIDLLEKRIGKVEKATS
jgi:hypothetical protein